ncbi:phosphoglycerate dehydrogenase, partial [Micromonospora sp. BL1]
MKAWIPHPEGRRLLGELPPGVTVELLDDPRRLPSSPVGVRFWVPPFLSGPDAGALLAELPDVEVVQLLSAGADAWVGRIPDGVTLCDAR